MKQLLFLCLLLGITFPGLSKAQARENVTDWYIQDFRAEFVVHADSTMTVTEWITADCGDLPDKHGIFRVLSTVAKTPDGTIQTPVELVSITDFTGKPYQFETTQNTSDDTVTWKIGDPDKTVTGVNEYKIVYSVKNVIRDQGDFHEWYWNVVGNFWTIPIDSFSATVKLPDEVAESNTKVQLYSGSLGNKGNGVAEADWVGSGSLGIKANRGLMLGEGITVSLSFPTTIFTPYRFSWWELYGKYFWFLIPAVVFVLLYRFWKKYGDDPEWDKPTIPEYEVPAGLNALTMGSLLKNGRIVSEHVTAALIELAVKGVITIRQETEKVLFFNHDEYVLEKHMPAGFVATTEQKKLLDKVFEMGESVKLSDLKRKFHPVLGELTKLSLDSLAHAGLVERKSFTYRAILSGIGLGGIFLFGFFGGFGWQAVAALGLTVALFILFGSLIPKRTELGVETYAKLKGLKLYMETAEKYRQRFHEKEGIFETLLPVAILFGITKEWIKKMEEIYGPEYFARYHPAWFAGSFDGGFNTESFTSAMEGVSSSIASNMGTSSGASGGGSSGGGGGGGGGGGW